LRADPGVPGHRAACRAGDPMNRPGPDTDPAVRQPAVAGTFYPGDPARLAKMVAALLAGAAAQAEVGGGPGIRPGAPAAPILPRGILVPHAGLAYSGLVAAAGWRLVPDGATVVILGTNHTAAWLNGVGAWGEGRWRTPVGDVAVDTDLASDILALGLPFGSDRAAHLGEHSIEVQLPLLRAAAPAARIVPLAVGYGTGTGAIAAGERLGALLADRRAAGASVVLAISTDMAHYPPADVCTRVTETLSPAIVGLLPEELARLEAAVGRSAGAGAGMACGMCGIEPAVLGLSALRAMGATAGVALASATSADAGADPRRTVGYLAVAFVG
jgi:AmmeMemoRadiSam system protein B